MDFGLQFHLCVFTDDFYLLQNFTKLQFSLRDETIWPTEGYWA